MTDPAPSSSGQRSAAPLAVVLLLFLAVAGVWALAPGADEAPVGKTGPVAGPTTAAKGPDVTFTPPPAPGPGGPDSVALPRGATPASGEGPVGFGVATPGGPGGATGPMKGFAPGKDPVDPDAPANAATGVRGRVVTSAGAAVEGAKVQLRGQRPGPQGMTMMMMKPGADGELEMVVQGETRSREATSGADGTFEVKGLDASFRYELHVTPPDGLLKAKAKGPALKAGQVVDAGDVAVKRAGVIEGTVSGPDGRPLEHARVALDGDGPFVGGPPGGDEGGGPKFTMARRAVRVSGPAPGGEGDGPPMPMFGRATKTDAQGRYRFDRVAPGEHALTATSKGLRAAKRTTSVTEGETARGVDLRLADGLALSVRVQDAGGAPIAKARVQVMAGFGGPQGGGGVETDAGGLARLAGLSSSEVTLAVTAPGFASFTSDVALGPGDPDTPRVVVLQPGGAVAGRLVREDGTPVAKAMVFLEPLVHGPDVDIQMGDDGRPDAEGRFRLGGVRPGAWKLRVQAPGLAPTSVTVEVGGTAAVDLGDVKLAALRALPVLVLDPDGAPVTDAVVDAGQGGRGMMVIAVKADSSDDAPPMVVARSARTGPDGRARIEGLEPGSFTLRATKAGLADGWAEATIPAEGQPPEATVRLTRGGKVVARVVAAPGESALPPVLVHLSRKGRDVPVASQQAGPAGEATFERVAPGDYQLAADGVPRDDAAWFTVQDDRTTSRTLQRAPQATLEGTVRGPDGAPLAGAPVSLGMLDLWHPDEQGLAFVSRRTTTDGAGRYRLEGVRPDRWGLAVTAGGRTFAFAVDVTGPGQVTRDLRLPVAAAASTVQLQAAGADGPLAGAKVTLERTDDGPVVRRERAADGEGRVRFEGVPAGEYALTAVAGGHARARGKVTVPAGAQVEAPRLQLEKGGALLVEVRLAGAAPPGRVEARVVVRPVGSKDPLEQSFALVDAGGPPVRIDGLTPGAAYEVVASAGGWRDVRVETTCQGEPTSPEALLLQRE